MDKIQLLHSNPSQSHASITEEMMGHFKNFCDLHKYTPDYTGIVIGFKKENDPAGFDKRYTMQELIDKFKETL